MSTKNYINLKSIKRSPKFLSSNGNKDIGIVVKDASPLNLI